MQDNIQRREKEVADEWIQRETAIMTQFAAKQQERDVEFESSLRTLETQLLQARSEAQQLAAERDAARDDVAVFQVMIVAFCTNYGSALYRL